LKQKKQKAILKQKAAKKEKAAITDEAKTINKFKIKAANALQKSSSVVKKAQADLKAKFKKVLAKKQFKIS
jgi:hypothetical protein